MVNESATAAPGRAKPAGLSNSFAVHYIIVCAVSYQGIGFAPAAGLKARCGNRPRALLDDEKGGCGLVVGWQFGPRRPVGQLAGSQRGLVFWHSPPISYLARQLLGEAGKAGKAGGGLFSWAVNCPTASGAVPAAAAPSIFLRWCAGSLPRSAARAGSDCKADASGPGTGPPFAAEGPTAIMWHHTIPGPGKPGRYLRRRPVGARWAAGNCCRVPR